MRISFQYIFIAVLFFIGCLFLFSCDKVNVNFGNSTQNGDPNVSFFQNYRVNLQTVQIDSFLTSAASTGTFMVGYHNDPVFGTIHASSYVQLQLPAINPIFDQNVTFDSLEIILKPHGNYYGDTTRSLNFKIYQLTEQIQNFISADNNYYNTQSFTYNPTAIGGQSFIVTPGNSNNIGIKMDASFGDSLLQKFQTGAVEINNPTTFLNYFNGIYIDADITSTNAIFSFTASDTLAMRLYYNLNGITPVQKYLDFPFVTSKQFTHIDYNRAGTLLSAFPAFINNKSVLSSSATGNKAFLNSSTGSYIKISFPDILNLKILYPYIKVLSAQLIIPPSPGSYNYPYKLPPTLFLYNTDDNNDVLNVVSDAAGSAQTGNLFIDNLNGQSTLYTYDITTFISSILNPPPNPAPTFANALLLTSSGSLTDESLTRLIVNDQNLGNGILLKLYVLGL